ncbi:MAG: helix-hairpin-helix domain-containing protein [Coprobacillus sp.]|nr:helix-hairpin-helix domain-containing protein [Coprobacillus sp.]
MVKVILIVFVVATVAICGFMLIDSSSANTVAAAVDSTSVNGGISLTIEGEILYPGTYTLSEGSNMLDLIVAAGGVSDNADERAYYASADLVGGETYYIASRFDETDMCNFDEIDKVNVNTDSASILATVNGISSSVATNIVSYRETNGQFYTIESLVNVSGIGNATYNKIRNYVILHE